MSRFHSATEALAKGATTGIRSGKAVKIIEDVLGETLPQSMRKLVQDFGFAHYANMGDELDEYDEASNFFDALLSGDFDEIPKVEPEVGDHICACLVRAAKEGRYKSQYYNDDFLSHDDFIKNLEEQQQNYKLNRSVRD